jgi:error-prone DNA polymerase
LGFRQVKGMREEDIQVLINSRETFYTSVAELRATGLSQSVLEKLADADAFRSLNMDRRQALWEISACDDKPTGIFTGQTSPAEIETKGQQIELPGMRDSEHVVRDYAATGLSLKAHPVSFVREKLSQLHIISTSELLDCKDGDTIKVAGLVLVRQRPGTAGGVCFITIEDEKGYANLVVFQNLFDTFRKEILQSRLLMVEGKMQKEGEVIHVIVKRCYDLTRLLGNLTLSMNENLPLLTLARADEKVSPVPHNRNTKPQNKEHSKDVFSKGRNFK